MTPCRFDVFQKCGPSDAFVYQYLASGNPQSCASGAQLLNLFHLQLQVSNFNTNLRDFCQSLFLILCQNRIFLSFSRQMHVKIPYINESDMFGSSIVFRWGPKDNLVRHVAMFMTGTRLIQRIITSKEQNKTNKKRC